MSSWLRVAKTNPPQHAVETKIINTKNKRPAGGSRRTKYREEKIQKRPPPRPISPRAPLFFFKFFSYFKFSLHCANKLASIHDKFLREQGTPDQYFCSRKQSEALIKSCSSSNLVGTCLFTFAVQHNSLFDPCNSPLAKNALITNCD